MRASRALTPHSPRRPKPLLASSFSSRCGAKGERGGERRGAGTAGRGPGQGRTEERGTLARPGRRASAASSTTHRARACRQRLHVDGGRPRPHLKLAGRGGGRARSELGERELRALLLFRIRLRGGPERGECLLHALAGEDLRGLRRGGRGGKGERGGGGGRYRGGMVISPSPTPILSPPTGRHRARRRIPNIGLNKGESEGAVPRAWAPRAWGPLPRRRQPTLRRLHPTPTCWATKMNTGGPCPTE